MARGKRNTVGPERGGFYQRFTPERFICSRCHEERNSIGQEDGIYLRCRWEARKAAREVRFRPSLI
jgi:hypothetical protein